MAVMDEKTFEIYHNDLGAVPDGYVEIDELIAPTVQVLNRKGYITKYCCSGHPFEKWVESKGLSNGTRPIRSYICFENGITLPRLPHGFSVSEVLERRFNTTVIEKTYFPDDDGKDHFYNIARQILVAMTDLYKWALDLPNYEDNGLSITTKE